MWKTLLVGTTALAIAGGSLALAQSPRSDTPRDQSTAQAAMLDARVARIKARLRLTAEQEKHWPAFETAIRDLAKERASRVGDRRSQRQGHADQVDVIDRLRQGADAMTTQANGLKKLADAAEPLYKSLDDDQKQRLATLLPAGQPRMGRWHADGPRFGEGRRFADRGHRGGWHGHHHGHGGHGPRGHHMR